MEGEAAARIREAIGSEDYQLASRLWSLYAGQLRDELLSGTACEARMAEARALVGWGRDVLICARSLALDNLNALHVPVPTGRKPHRVRGSSGPAYSLSAVCRGAAPPGRPAVQRPRSFSGRCPSSSDESPRKSCPPRRPQTGRSVRSRSCCPLLRIRPRGARARTGCST
jgi:hypothetical protein